MTYEGVVDSDERKDEKVDFTNKLALDFGVDGFAHLVGVIEQGEGDIAVIFAGFCTELELGGCGWEFDRDFVVVRGDAWFVFHIGRHGCGRRSGAKMWSSSRSQSRVGI